MQLSALLALLPLAAALPRAVEVETRSSTQDCYAAYGNCCDPTKGKGPYNEATNLMIAACIPGRIRCSTALNECLGNATEKRSVEEAPLEARDIDVKDECDHQFDQCCGIPGIWRGEIRSMLEAQCSWQCFEDLHQCKAKPAEKRSVEEAPLEARDIDVKDECDQQFDQCCGIPGIWRGEIRSMLEAQCSWQCFEDLHQCKAKQTEKRSVEEAPLEARDNGSEATTACYGKLASCKHKGTPVAECFGNLSRCVQDVYQKFHG